MFTLNVPTTERVIRVLLGLALALYAWVAVAPPNVVFAATDMCIALTGVVGFCPACALVGRRLKSKG